MRRISEAIINSKSHPCIARAAFAVVLLFCAAASHRASAETPDADTTIVAVDDTPVDFGYDSDDSPPAVRNYTPIRGITRLSDINADSLSLTRNLPGWIRGFINSWTQGESSDRTRTRRFDATFGIAPQYSREASFGLTVALTGLYRIRRDDNLPEPSMMYVAASASLNGFFVIRTNGNILFPDNRWRFDYQFEASRKALHFWGITADETSRNETSKYDRREIKFCADFNYRLLGPVFAGPSVDIDYTIGSDFRNPEYLLGERRHIFAAGAGATVSFDTRDNLTAPSRGLLVRNRMLFYPGCFVTTRRFFWSESLVVDWYRRLWRGAVLACDFYMKLNSGATPWTMREMAAADDSRLRGYYMGSYIDNDQIALQAELRQHLYDRLGVAAWLGGGTIFNRDGAGGRKAERVWLPNGGVGIRVRFRKNINGRVDVGFGKRGAAVVIAVGEAF